MGCDIHTHAERKNDKGEWQKIPGVEPFDWRSYGVFGFLADVRNYSEVPPIAAQRGLPDDISDDVRIDYDDWCGDAHSASWLSVSELAQFDYDKTMIYRRDYGALAKPKETTYRDFLGKMFFDDLAKLVESGAERVVFWFDN